MKKTIQPIYLFVLMTVISVVSFMSSFLTQDNSFVNWILDLCSHWQMLYFFLACIFLILCIKKHADIAIICFISIAFIAFNPIYQLGHLSHNQHKNEHIFKIMSSNVLFTTNNLTHLEQIIYKEQPDLVYLIEVNFQHIPKLESIAKKDDYFLIANPENSPFGYAVLSKNKIEINKVSMPEEFIYFSEQNMCGALVHLMPPVSPHAKNIRDTTLNNMTQSMQNCHKKISFIAGDFNASPWSYPLEVLKAQGYYSGSHIQPTWPTFFIGIIGIPIDHILINKQHNFLRYEVINPDNKSDHYTLIAEIN